MAASLEDVGVDPAEADPLRVEPFADGVAVAAGGLWWWPRRHGGCAAGVESSTLPVDEHDPIGIVGVARDAETAVMMHAVMARTQTDQIPRVGSAAVEPVDDVVHLDESVVGASGHPAALVATLDDAARAIGHDPL